MCLALFLALYSPILLHYALAAPIFLDEIDALARIKRSPLDFNTPEDYVYAVDHPALHHWCARAVLSLLGITIPDLPKVDIRKDYEWNVANGRIAPRPPVLALRVLNVLLLSAALAALFLAVKLALGNCLWAFLVAAPLVLPPALGTYVAGYIKTDAYLAFFIALTLFLWLKFHLSSTGYRFTHLLVMALVTGLAVSTKLNGGLLVLAYALYLVIRARGFDRLWRPAVFMLFLFAVFIIVNPVTQKSGLLWPLEVMRDMLARRDRISAFHDTYLGKADALSLITFMFPYWYLLPVFAIIVYHAKREPWFAPVLIWSLFLILGTALSTRQPFQRYLMPLNFGLVTIVILSTVALARRLYHREITFRDLLRAQLPPPAH